VVRPLALVAVRQQQDHAGLLAPLLLAGADELVDDRLRAVREVAELRLPQPCANGTGPNPGLAKPLSAADAKDCKRVDMSSKVRTPDVLVQPHMASLEMTFYPNVMRRTQGVAFPSSFNGGIFAAEHGSWNRANRAGYEVIYIPMKDGHATGEYDDFLTGFVTPDGQVWGRPVGVAVGADGSLYVTDDGSRSVWHVSYISK